MKRIRVVNNQNGHSCIVTYKRGKISLFHYGWKEPTTFYGTEEEFDNDWSNPEFYANGENEVFDV